MKKFHLLSCLLTLFCLSLSLFRPHFFESLERKFYDLHFALRGSIAGSGQIVFVTIDEKSLDHFGRWPWSRRLLAELFEKLISAGAKLIVPDIFFADPSKESDDLVMAKTLREHPNILAGYFFQLSGKDFQEDNLSSERMEEDFQNLVSSSLSIEKTPVGIQEAVGLQAALPLFFNLPGGRHGFFNLDNDSDGTIRASSLWMRYRDKIFPSIFLQAAMRMSHVSHLPLRSDGKFLINYRGTKTFPRISVVDFLKGNSSHPIENKIVFIGSVAAGLEDNRPTPIDPVTPSTIILATIVDNILQGDFLKNDRITHLVSCLLILLTGVILGLFLPRWKPAKGFLFTIAFLLIEVLLIHAVFVQWRWVLQNIYPVFSTFFIYGGISFYGYFVEEKDKRFITDTFSHYLSSDVIRELMEHPEKIRLGGERRELTIFFSDIRDFTSITEDLPPETLVEFLNGYLTPVTDIIFQNKGLLDKYIGDAVMSVFGVPLPDPDHPRLACQTAVDMVRLVNETREKWRQDYGIPSLHIGIGINTGLATVGNMGSDRRFDYTVIGDSVNLASRIEGLNKFYGTHILISQSTWERVRNLFLFREIDMVQVKGKKEVVRIYELLADPVFDPKIFLPIFSEALSHYRTGQFATARTLFEKCLKLSPQDGPSHLFLNRCCEMEIHPPSEWNGVTIHIRK